MELESKIEAVLFFRGEPTGIDRLAEIIGESVEDTREAVLGLREHLSERGITIVEKDDEVMLGTNPEYSPLIEKVIKEDLHRDLGKAGLETLSIILYFGPVPRSKIDYIRGVSSTFIIRNLLIRGLVERVENPDDKRSFLYKPTFELFSYLGIERAEDLPEYTEVRNELSARAVAETEAEKNTDA